MQTFHPQLILCATDFSGLATFALEYARDLAACSKARLLVIYADPFTPPVEFTSMQIEGLLKALEESKQSARHELSEYVRRHVGSEIEAEVKIVEDLPVSAIVHTAEERNADLIVMGTHGRSGFSRLMMGSVAERVLRMTRSPVLTVRHKRDTGERVSFSIRRVLCPVNDTPVAQKALDHAGAVAECFQAELHVLSVVESSAHETTDQDEINQLSLRLPAEYRSSEAIRIMVRRGNPAEQIIRAADELNCDMIVLGAQHQRFFDTTVIGTTTVRVNRHAPCPVMTVIRAAKED